MYQCHRLCCTVIICAALLPLKSCVFKTETYKYDNPETRARCTHKVEDQDPKESTQYPVQILYLERTIHAMLLFRPNTIRKIFPSFALVQPYSYPPGAFLSCRNARKRSTAALLSAVSVNNDQSTTATATATATKSTTENNMGLYRLLTAQERDLLSEQRQLTDTCKKLAAQVLGGVTDENKTIFSQLEPNFLNVEASFSVVIAGEFNAGKSTLINALLGQKLLESGALPTTDSITIVASSDHKTALPLGVIWHTVSDVPVLTDLTIVDTPGTNSTWLDHTEQTMRLLPAADLILFVTSADRPFSESERNLLKGIQAYRKSIVVVVNKMDILEFDGGDHGKEAKQAVVDFVIERSSELLGARPIVIPLSARDALSAKLMEKKNDAQRSNVWLRSQFEVLESFLKDSLTTQAKLKSKLVNPIGVVEGVLRECSKVLDEQSQDLQSDIATLNVLQAQFGGWKKELTSDLRDFQQGITKGVRSQGERWNILLNRMNIFSFHYNVLMDRAKFDEEWDETRPTTSVHNPKGLKSDILSQVEQVADSVATRGRAQGQAVIEYLGKRPAMKNQSLVGYVTAASRFEDTRRNLSEQLSSAVNNTLRLDQEEKEKEEVFKSLWTTAAISTGLETFALGTALGVLLELIDPIPGLMIASSLVLSGGACYTLGTSRVAQSYDGKWLDRSKRLEEALASICDKEVERVSRHILDGVGPYTRFVESEQERIASLQEQSEGLSSVARNLRNRISKLHR